MMPVSASTFDEEIGRRLPDAALGAFCTLAREQQPLGEGSGGAVDIGIGAPVHGLVRHERHPVGASAASRLTRVR